MGATKLEDRWLASCAALVDIGWLTAIGEEMRVLFYCSGAHTELRITIDKAAGSMVGANENLLSDFITGQTVAFRESHNVECISQPRLTFVTRDTGADVDLR